MPYCAQQMDLLFGERIYKVRAYGSGLWATRDFEKGDWILPYDGKENRVKWPTTAGHAGYAALINHKSKTQANPQVVMIRNRHRGQQVWVQAVKAIKAGTQLSVNRADEHHH